MVGVPAVKEWERNGSLRAVCIPQSFVSGFAGNRKSKSNTIKREALGEKIQKGSLAVIPDIYRSLTDVHGYFL